MKFEERIAHAEAYANEYVDARHIDGPIAARIALGVKAGYLKALEDRDADTTRNAVHTGCICVGKHGANPYCGDSTQDDKQGDGK
jgi:hypothetical protein